MAVVGILSDSHGEHLRTRAALQLLASLDCSLIIHLGDVETVEVLDECAGFPMQLVFGNCDSVVQLEGYARDLGISVKHPAGIVTVDDTTFGFLHGDDFQTYEQFLNNDSINVVLHGHTHEKRDEMVEDTRCINPGALHRASSYTVATFDTATSIVAFHEIVD